MPGSGSKNHSPCDDHFVLAELGHYGHWFHFLQLPGENMWYQDRLCLLKLLVCDLKNVCPWDWIFLNTKLWTLMYSSIACSSAWVVIEDFDLDNKYRFLPDSFSLFSLHSQAIQECLHLNFSVLVLYLFFTLLKAKTFMEVTHVLYNASSLLI